MFNCFLNEAVKTSRIKNAVAAGTTPQSCTTLDMANFDAVRATALIGALTATQVTNLKAQQGDQANGSDAADISGVITANMADGDSNKMLILDVHKSQITKRYVTFVVNRGTANAVIDGVMADQYRARTLPQVPDATTVSQYKQAA